MSRVVIAAPVTVGGQTFKRGDCIEASAALVTALGSSDRTLTLNPAAASPARDQLGESVVVANLSL